MSIKVKCTASRELFHKDSFYIISFVPFTPLPDGLELGKYGTFTCKGDLGFVTINKEYTLIIEPIEKNQYGTTYSVKEVPSMQLEELNDDSELDILKEITTDSQAQYVHDAYPNYVRLVLNGEEDKIDVKKIYNVADVRNKAYIRLLLTKFKYFYLKQKLLDWEVDVDDCKALYERFIDEATIMQEIKTHPYMTLIQCLKRSFINADRLILKLRPDLKVSNQRCEFCIADILSKNEEDGNTYIDANDMYIIMRDGYDVGNKHFDYNVPELLPLVVETCNNSDTLYYDPKTKRLSILETYLGEVRISNFIKEKLNNSTKLDIDWTKYTKIKDGVLTDEQSNVLRSTCENPLLVLDSAAGTGKSSTMMAVLQMLEDNHLSYTCVSFTGRAAKRLSEQTNRPACTIHKACNAGFLTDYLVVDEASMLSIELMCMLITEAEKNPNMRILLVGDACQIPSISLGRIMKDIIESNKVPVCTLTKCFRFAQGGMSMVSTLCRQGKFYIDDDQDEIIMGNNKDYKFVRFNGDINQIVEEYAKLIKKGIKRDNISILTPMNIKEFGAININNKIQQYINPPLPNENNIIIKLDGKEIVFRTGDLVMNTKNNYKTLTLDGFNQMKNDPILSKDDVDTGEIFNGEIGKILSFDSDGKHMSVQFGENIFVFDKFDAHKLILAYASNPFKMQGSQNDWIIVLTLNCHKHMLNRQLQYTSLTRAAKGIVEIGELDAMKECVDTLGDDSRLTYLKDLLMEG